MRSRADFDKAYINLMVQDHKKNINEFTIAMDKVGYPDIKNFISNALPVLQKHLDVIQTIKIKM